MPQEKLISSSAKIAELVIKSIIVAVVYFLSARLAFLLPFPQTGAIPVWPATGVALALCLISGRRMWPGIFLGAFLAKISILGGSLSLIPALYLSLGSAAGYTLEALAGAYLVRRFIKSRLPLDRTRDALYFILLGAMAGTGVGSLIGVTGDRLFHGGWSISGSLLLNWWLADLAGVVVFAPVILAWRQRRHERWNSLKYFELGALAILIILVEALVFLFKYPLPYLIIPLLLWLALRFGPFEVAVALAAVMGSFVVFTIKGFDPLAGRTPHEALLFLQSYVALTAVTILLASSLRTEHQKTEKDTIEAKQRLYDIVDFLPDPTLAIDHEGRVIVWNRAIEKMTGVPKEKILGQGNHAYALPFFGERRPILVDLVLPGDKVAREDGRYAKDYDQFDRRGHVVYAERYYPGMDRYLSGAASLLIGQDGRPHGAIESIRDISERKKLEQELVGHRERLDSQVRERTAELIKTNDQLTKEMEERVHSEEMLVQSETKYRSLVESANSIIMRWSPDGRITFLNSYALDFFGYREEEIIGQNILGTIVPLQESTGRDLSSLAADIAQNPEAYVRNVNENVRQNGERVWIAWANTPIFDGTGYVHEIQSVGNDITRFKETEDALLRTLAELAVAKERAEAADRLKSAFLATMSHELRTPLNSIIGFTGIILQERVGPLNDEQRKQLTMVRTSSRHLLALINDVLDISKIEAGQMQLTSDSFDLRAVIEKVVQNTRPLAEKKALDLLIECSPDIGVMIGDSRRVEQVLLNLIRNAVKFTDKGHIKIQGESDGRRVTLRVIDTGIGIKAEDLGTLFKPFSQIDSGITRKYDGSGLGLSICKRFVELMGGTIGVVSTWGSGSTFSFSLPQRKDAHEK